MVSFDSCKYLVTDETLITVTAQSVVIVGIGF